MARDLSFGPSGSCSLPKVFILSSNLPSPQRSFTLAVIATIVCLPLLLLDLVWASGAADTEVPAVGAESTVVAERSSETSVAAPTSVASTPGSSRVVPTSVVSNAPAATSSSRRTPPATAAPVRSTPSTTTAPPPPPVSGSDLEFLACVRARESGGNYAIVDGSGNYMGAYQFSQSTWDSVASRAGRSDLVGVRPNTTSPSDQDAIALATLAISGRSPWGGSCG